MSGSDRNERDSTEAGKLEMPAFPGHRAMESQNSDKARAYVIQTSSEADAFASAAADGKHGRNYKENEMAGVRAHARPNSRHSVQLSLTPEETEAGLTVAALERLTREQDADGVLMFFYIAQVLSPPSPHPRREYSNGIIDFDDVIAKIGWDPRSTAERREMHRRIYEFIRFGQRAQVVGHRVGQYIDKHTGRAIDTEIRSSPWQVHKWEFPDQKSLPFEAEVPIRVEIAMAPDWANLLAAPQTAQYLPMGEVLGAIPGSKPSGAWARVIGIALAGFWRRNPKEALSGSLRPTRRELIDSYPPKTGTIHQVLQSGNPKYVFGYWQQALRILADCQFIADSGEACLSEEAMRAGLPYRGWGDVWLDRTVDLMPGELMRQAVEGRALAIPEPPAKRGRGRPRKPRQAT